MDLFLQLQGNAVKLYITNLQTVLQQNENQNNRPVIKNQNSFNIFLFERLLFGDIIKGLVPN